MKITSALQGGSIRKPIPLTDEEMFKVAPSIFAAEPYHDRSQHYRLIPTIEVVNALKQGFQPFMAAQSKTMEEDRRGHTKHMLRLRQSTEIQSDQANEIVLINSHGATASSYILAAGLFRSVCANGTIFGDVNSQVRIAHRGQNIVDQVIEGTFYVVDQFEDMDESREMMQSITLQDREQQAFARSALALRYDPILDEEGNPITDSAGFVKTKSPLTAGQILRPRRFADTKDDLWTVFNRVQENLIRGGLAGQTYDKNGRPKRTRTRAITSINEDFRLNRGLWTLAQAMVQLKEAA